MRRRTVIALCLSLARTASAQTAQESARESFERGLAALQGGRMHDAALAFSESYRQSPFPGVLYNLGLALRGEGRSVEAVDAFEQYLLAPEADAAPEVLATVRSEVARLRGTLVLVHASVRPAQTTLTVDGQRPTRVLDDLLLTPGPHLLVASSPGYRTQQREITLGAGQSERADFALEAPARLTVNPNVTDAAVSVDGQLQGLGVTAVSLDPGAHTVDVRATGYVPQRRQVIASNTGSLRLDVALTRVTPPPSRAWVWPVVVGAGVLVVGSIVAAVLAAPDATPEYPGSWATVRE